jgi:uncharacterized protein YvpB
VAPQAALAESRGRVYLDVPHYSQWHSLSCEMAALRMAAAYHGLDRHEDSLLVLLPTDPAQPRVAGEDLHWLDPDRLFPGNVDGAQLYHGGLSEHPNRARRGKWGYGVYARPIAEVATKLGLRALVFDEVEHVYRSLDRRNVPIVIVPWGGRTETRVWEWVTPGGERIAVMNAQHAVAAIGYSSDRVWVRDPARMVSTYQRGAFEKAFGLIRSGVEIGPPARISYVPI